MKVWSVLLAVLSATSMAIAGTDPFVGTWVFSAEKSPKPTITYAIRDLGGERYALTGSTGETTEIKADGNPIKSPSGATVSFRKLASDTWQMNRVTTGSLVRTYTVSADDKTLQLVDLLSLPEGGKEKTTTVYTRTSPGKSLFGNWRSISITDEMSAGGASGPLEAGKLIIAPFGSDGLSFTSPSEKHRTEMRFDGKEYFEMGPDGKTGDSSSGERVSDRLIEVLDVVKGKPESRSEYRVSEDGKTLTMVSKSTKTESVFTYVFDKE